MCEMSWDSAPQVPAQVSSENDNKTNTTVRILISCIHIKHECSYKEACRLIPEQHYFIRGALRIAMAVSYVTKSCSCTRASLTQDNALCA